jgi:hypothetical protein
VNQFTGPAFPGASMGVPGVSGGTGGYVAGQTSYYDWTTNGYSTYHCSQSLLDFQPGDTGVEQITFGRTEASTTLLDSDKRRHGQQMFGLSQWNYMMQHDRLWRKKWGSMRNAIDVMASWNYKGVQRSTQELIGRSKDGSGHITAGTDENVFIIFGRTRMPNIWLAEDKVSGHVGEGMHCHILLRRHRYVADDASRAATWVPRDPEARRQRAMVHEMRAAAAAAPAPPRPVGEGELRFDDTQSMFPSFDAAEGQEFILKPEFGEQTRRIDESLDHGNNDDKDEPGTEYYWSWDPYVSNTGTVPPPELYKNHNGTGTYIDIGMMHHSLKGSQNYSPDKCRRAREGIYPTTRGKDYQEAYYSLPAIEIHQRAQNRRAA